MALAVLGVVLSLCVVPSSVAQDFQRCLKTTDHCDEGAAYVAATAWASFKAGVPNRIGCVLPQSSSSFYAGWTNAGKTCSSANIGEGQFYRYEAKCSARLEETSWKGDKSGIGAVCHNGCKYTDSIYAGSPTGHLYTPSGDTCRTDELAPPEIADPGEGGDGGASGPTTGRLYKKSGKTVQKVLAEFKTAIEGAPILSKVKGFFGSCTGGGSCPTATWDGGQYAGKFDLGNLCSGPLLQLFQYAGFVFLAGMGVVALRWALL